MSCVQPTSIGYYRILQSSIGSESISVSRWVDVARISPECINPSRGTVTEHDRRYGCIHVSHSDQNKIIDTGQPWSRSGQNVQYHISTGEHNTGTTGGGTALIQA